MDRMQEARVDLWKAMSGRFIPTGVLEDMGYNAEEIRAFIPRELRRLQECSNSDFCPQFTDIKEQYYQDHQCKDGCE